MNISALGTPTAAAARQPPPADSKAGTPQAAATPAVAKYPSPILVLDAASGALVLEYRNVVTGTVEYDTPSRAALRYRQTQHLAAVS